MKKWFLICISAFLFCSAFGQTAGKIGGVNDNAINKIGSVPISSVGKTGNVTTQVFFKNCKEIKQINPGATDGVYTIDSDGSGTMAPFNCYCDMTTNGGGWTMVGYYRHPATENAPPDLDNRDYAYFIKARTDQFYGRSEFIANPNSDGAWTDWRVLSNITWPIEFAIILDQSSWSTAWEDYFAKIIYRVKDRLVMPNYGTTEDLVSGDNLYYKQFFSSGWTDVGSSSISDYYFWYPYSLSGNYLTNFHESNYAYIPSGVSSDYHYCIYYGSGMGGSSTWHHSGRLLVR